MLPLCLLFYGDFLKFFVLQFLYPSNMDNNNAYFLGLFSGLNEFTHMKNLKQCLAQFNCSIEITHIYYYLSMLLLLVYLIVFPSFMYMN